MIDNKDRKILSLICDDARISKKRLAKKLGMSREVVSYHLKKLEENGVILGYQTRLNLNAFSIMGYNLFVKLKYYDNGIEKKMVEFFKDQKYTHFVAKVGGNYDYMVGFTIKNLSDLKVYLDNFDESFGEKIIRDYDVFTMLEEIKDNVATLFNKTTIKSLVSMKKVDVMPKIDKIDKLIITSVVKNARIPCVEIGQKLNLTGAAVAYRLKKLEKQEVILGYRTMVDVLKFDKQFYYISFNLSVFNKRMRQRVVSEIISNPNIVFSNNLSGKYSYVCWLFAKNNNDFYEIIKKLQNDIPEITGVNIYTVLDFIHQTYIPNGFLD